VFAPVSSPVLVHSFSQQLHLHKIVGADTNQRMCQNLMANVVSWRAW
jgi:hypothetical protein